MHPEAVVLDDTMAAKLEDAVRRTLCERGMWVRFRPMLEALAVRGAQVNFEEGRARMTNEIIDAAIELNRRTQPEPRPSMVSPETYSASLGFLICPHYYDHETGRARLATTDDLILATKLGHAHPDVTSVAQAHAIASVPQVIEPLASFLVVAQHTDKPMSTSSLIREHSPYFYRLAEILSDEGAPNRFIGSGGWLHSPLTVPQRIAELVADAPNWDKHTASGSSMVIAGLSAPITRAGAVVIGASEILGSWCAYLAHNPDLKGLGGGVCTGVVDPRTTRGCFGAPEAVKQDIAICELFDQRFGGGIGVSGPGYTEAKAPGPQIAFEKTMKALYIAHCRKQPARIGNPGLIDGGRTFSPLQFIIDLEMDRALWQLHRAMPCDDDDIGMDAILEGTEKFGQSFLGLEHTARMFRERLWMPEIFDREVSYRPNEREEEAFLMRARQKMHDLLDSYGPTSHPPEEIAAIEEVVEDARRELLDKNVASFKA